MHGWAGQWHYTLLILLPYRRVVSQSLVHCYQLELTTSSASCCSISLGGCASWGGVGAVELSRRVRRLAFNCSPTHRRCITQINWHPVAPAACRSSFGTRRQPLSYMSVLGWRLFERRYKNRFSYLIAFNAPHFVGECQRLPTRAAGCLVRPTACRCRCFSTHLCVNYNKIH